MSGLFYDVPPEVSTLAAMLKNLAACVGAKGCGSPPPSVPHQFAAAMPQQKDAVAAASQALAASKTKRAKSGKSGKSGKGGERAKGGKGGKSATPSVQAPCRYGLTCTRPVCAFQHPKSKAPPQQTPCRYGDTCYRSDCRHTHPNGPNRSGLVCKHGPSCYGQNGKCPFNHP